MLVEKYDEKLLASILICIPSWNLYWRSATSSLCQKNSYRVCVRWINAGKSVPSMWSVLQSGRDVYVYASYDHSYPLRSTKVVQILSSNTHKSSSEHRGHTVKPKWCPLYENSNVSLYKLQLVSAKRSKKKVTVGGKRKMSRFARISESIFFLIDTF